MTDAASHHANPFPRQAFISALLFNAVWINASEVFRYFAFIMGMMREALPELPGAAPMNITIFALWGIWDTLLVIAATLFSYLWFERFGYGVKQAVQAGFAIWAAIFVILWLGLHNMALATPAIMAVALPLALLEMIVAALITRWRLSRR